MPFILLSLLFCGFIITGGFIWYQSFLFWKSPILVDGQLKIRLIALKDKPVDYVPKPKNHFEKAYPRS